MKLSSPLKIIEYVRKTIFILIVVGIPSSMLSYYNRHNPIFALSQENKELSSAIPQGWAFFTKTPQEDIYKLYQIKSDSQLVQRINKTSLSPSDFFGILRNTRRLNNEFLGGLMTNLLDWHSVDKEKNWKDECLNIQKFNTIKMKNSLFKNEQLIIYWRRRTPWSWVKSDPKIPCKCAKIWVK